jgi:hypothetical protein
MTASVISKPQTGQGFSTPSSDGERCIDICFPRCASFGKKQIRTPGWGAGEGVWVRSRGTLAAVLSTLSIDDWSMVICAKMLTVDLTSVLCEGLRRRVPLDLWAGWPSVVFADSSLN